MMTILLVSRVGALTAENCQTTVSVMCQGGSDRVSIGLPRGTGNPEEDLPTALVLLSIQPCFGLLLLAVTWFSL